MGGFTKIDNGILRSTLWPDLDARNVFLTALFMAEPYELEAPTPQIEVRTLDLTGFVVQPGWYGFVHAAGVGIITQSGILDREAGMRALERLGARELDSRTPDFEGRRLVRVEGGYIVLNFQKYRDRDYTARDRQERWRKRQKEKRDRRDDA